MRKSTLIWLIVAAALLLTGSILFIAVMSANNWDISAFSNREYENHIYDIREPFSDIIIHSDTADITFTTFAVDPTGKLDDQPSYVRVYEDPKLRHEVSVQNGVLVIELKDEKSWYDHINFYAMDNPSITISLRQVQYGTLLIEEETGDVVIPEGLSFDNILVSADTGDVCCYSSVSDRLGIQTSTGRIDVSDITASYLGLDAATGRITVSSVECDGFDALVSTGRITLNDIICKSFYSKGTTGDIRMTDVAVSGSMYIERSTGDVEFERCDAAKVYIGTDTGDVSGSFLSPKVFTIQADNGRVDVPWTFTGGDCKVITDTGDIHITIEQ